MDSVSSRRWSLAFVVHRWRHLMWLCPLGGLLVAGAMEWQKHQRSLQPSGEIAVTPPSRLPVPPLFAGQFPTLGFAEIRALALSDEVLAAACDYAELTDDGTPLEQCIAELRPRIQCTPIPGSPSALISVAGKPSTETKLLTEAVVRKTEWYANKTAAAKRSRILGLEAKAVAALKKPSRDPIVVPVVIQFSHGPMLKELASDSSVLQVPAPESEYTRRKTQLFLAAGFDTTPLVVKRWPWTTLPLPSTRQRLQEGTPTIMMGIGTGILAAVALAYLLEALFPRQARKQVLLDP